MNENVKTIAFVGLAVAVSLVVWFTRPRLPELHAENELPKELFPDFDDPLKAASLEIVEFDETTATLKPFKVAQVNEEWSIPSHDDYPADAKDHLAEAATGLMGLKPLDVAGAFTLDGLGGWFLDGVDGDPSNVIGLSLPLVRRMLERVNLSVPELWTR